MVETRILHEQGLRERAFCAQNELTLSQRVVPALSSTRGSPVSLPTAVSLLARRITAWSHFQKSV